MGQVYAFEGKHKEALDAFRQAQVLDPSLRFASSSSEFIKKLGNEQALVAPAPVVVTQVQAPFPVPREVSMKPQQESNDSGTGTILVILMIIAACTALGAVIMNYRKRSTNQKIKENAIQSQKNTLLDLSKKLEDATLITKSATYSDVAKRQILDRIGALQSQVRNVLAQLKDGEEVSSSRMATIQNNVEDVVENSANGCSVPAAEHSVETERQYTAPPTPFTPPQSMPAAPVPTFIRTPTPPVIHHHYSSSPAPAPVVVQNSSNDMLTGILIGDALSRHSERTVYVERESPRRVERDEYVAEPAPAPRYYAPAPAPEYDDSSSRRNDSYTDSSPMIDSSSDSSSSSDSDSY